MGEIGVDKGVISRGRFFFGASPWLTSPVRARGRSGSIDLRGGGLRRTAAGRRRDGPARGPRAPASSPPRTARTTMTMTAMAGFPTRGSRSPRRTRRPRRPAGPALGRGRTIGPVPTDRRTGRRSGGRPAYRDGPAASPGPPSGAPVPGRVPPGTGPRPGRGGNGWASRFRSEVSAQIARNVSGTMNWSRMLELSSSLVLRVALVHWPDRVDTIE